MLTIFAIVFVQQGRRNVPVMYPGRRVGNRMSMPVKGTLPLMVNMAGMIPLIFAQSLLTFPAIVGQFLCQLANRVGEASWPADPEHLRRARAISTGSCTFSWWWRFTFFYTNVLFAQQNYGENLKRVGAQIPGVSRGAPTQRYLNKCPARITLPGALFLGIVAVLPWLVSLLIPAFGNSQAAAFFLVSSAGLLIVVGVVRDTFFNIQAELKLHGYDDALLITLGE